MAEPKVSLTAINREELDVRLYVLALIAFARQLQDEGQVSRA